MSTRQSQQGVDVETGAIYGAGAYIVGLIISIIAVETEIIDELAFYGAIDFEGYLLAQQAVHELNIITSGDFISEFLPLTVVMIIVLVAAGYLAASREGTPRDGEGLTNGAAIVIGYLAVALVATIILFVQFDDADTTDALLTLIVTGIVYPVVFGGIGGLVAENA